MRKLITAALAVAGIAVAGLAATSAPATAQQVETAKISEVLLTTDALADLDTPSSLVPDVTGVEVFNPAGATGVLASLANYKIQACTTSSSPVPQYTFPSTTPAKPRYAIADKAGWTAQTAFPDMNRQVGGVLLVDDSGNYVDGVIINDSPTVQACMTSVPQAPNQADIARAAVSTDSLSAQRLADVNEFELRSPTFEKVDGSSNPII